MRIKFLFLGLLLIFLFGCAASVTHYLQYNIVLEEVERPAEANKRYGEHKISPTVEEGYTYMYEDEMIKILWLPSPKDLRFLIENKTNHSIKIIWDKAAYICEKGESHKVMHAGIKYSQRNAPQRPSVIDQKEVITDYVYPIDYVHYADDGWVERPMWSGQWVEKPLLLYSQKGGDPQKLLNKAKSNIDKTIQVLLPIELEDFTNNYIFTFKVKDVNLATQ